MVLKLYGHKVQVANDGLTGLELTRNAQPDVLLLDIGLPGMDGYQVARTLRSDGFDRKIVAITGYGTSVDKEQTKDAGFDYHMVKPIDPPELERLLNTEVSNSLTT